MSGCGRPTKGSHKNDDSLPCGTKLFYGQNPNDRRETVLLCPKCKVEEKL